MGYLPPHGDCHRGRETPVGDPRSGFSAEPLSHSLRVYFRVCEPALAGPCLRRF
jgi:hypothetical protein